MEDSQLMTTQGCGYHKPAVEASPFSFNDYNRFSVEGHYGVCARDDAAVIKHTYVQQALQQQQQQTGMCLQETQFCPSSQEQSEVRCSAVTSGISEEKTDLDRRVITPDSTDMVGRVGHEINANVTDAVTTSADATEPCKSEIPENKPPMSYIGLISKAILQSPDRRMNLGAIYSWMERNFPYFRQNSRGWRNSVRHNLSLNDCFIKAGRCEDGKGNYWTIHPENLDDFIRGDFRLRRRSRRRGRKGDSGRSDVLVKPSFQSSPTASGQLYVPSSMSTTSSFPHAQSYLIQETSPSYPPSYNAPYTVYESSSSPHGPPITPYAPWTYPQGGEQCVDLFVSPSGHNYAHNTTHVYGYTNYSYPSYGYQPSQW